MICRREENVMPYISTIGNQLLVTPFDNKSNVPQIVTNKLQPEEFCKYCYSYPIFEQQHYINENLKEESDDLFVNQDELENQIYQQKKSYENFELWLNNFKNSKVYTINGNAGTGKTTFINYKKYTEKEVKWVILDINYARSYDEWIADVKTVISNFELAQSKVYGSIMNSLYKLIFDGTDEKDNYSLEMKLTRNYRERFACQYPSGRKLFDEICKEMEGNETFNKKIIRKDVNMMNESK